MTTKTFIRERSIIILQIKKLLSIIITLAVVIVGGVALFTGVTEVFDATAISGKYTIYINKFDVDKGNVKLVLVQDDKIVHEFTPNEAAQEYTLENASGSRISLRIAGESADFKLDII